MEMLHDRYKLILEKNGLLVLGGKSFPSHIAGNKYAEECESDSSVVAFDNITECYENKFKWYVDWKIDVKCSFTYKSTSNFTGYIVCFYYKNVLLEQYADSLKYDYCKNRTGEPINYTFLTYQTMCNDHKRIYECTLELHNMVVQYGIDYVHRWIENESERFVKHLEGFLQRKPNNLSIPGISKYYTSHYCPCEPERYRTFIFEHRIYHAIRSMIDFNKHIDLYVYIRQALLLIKEFNCIEMQDFRKTLVAGSDAEELINKNIIHIERFLDENKEYIR